MDRFLSRTRSAYTSLSVFSFFFCFYMMFSAAAQFAKGSYVGTVVFFLVAALNFFAGIDNWKMRGVTKKMIEELK